MNCITSKVVSYYYIISIYYQISTSLIEEDCRRLQLLTK